MREIGASKHQKVSGKKFECISRHTTPHLEMVKYVKWGITQIHLVTP